MKRIEIDLERRTEQHCLSGSTYQIDGHIERINGNLYFDRTYVQHPEIARVRSLVLPHQHLWLLFFEGRQRPYPIRCYINMARIIDQGNRITIEDMYLDVVIHQDGQWQLVDVAEFREAVAAGHVTPEQMQAALLGLEYASRLATESGGDIEAYLLNRLAVGEC